MRKKGIAHCIIRAGCRQDSKCVTEFSPQEFCHLSARDFRLAKAIQYRDEYARRSGHWYFVRRRHLLWYGRDVGTNPLGLRPANWPEHHDGWGELPEASPTWADFWGDDAPRH